MKRRTTFDLDEFLDTPFWARQSLEGRDSNPLLKKIRRLCAGRLQVAEVLTESFFFVVIIITQEALCS
jgi:hypothetical protein